MDDTLWLVAWNSTVFLLAVYAASGSWTAAVVSLGGLLAGLTFLRHPQVPESRVKDFFGGGGPFVIAHRGAALDAPENTLGAIRLAKANGAHAVELDVAFTRDGRAVILHDDTVDRTTNGTGRIRDMSLAEARTLNAAARHERSSAFPDEPIPTLEEAIVLCEELGLKIFLDIKGDSAGLTVKTLADAYSNHPYLRNSAVVASFQSSVIYRLRAAIPEAITGLTHQHKVNQYTADGQRKHRGDLAHFVAEVVDIILGWSQDTWLWYVCGNSLYIICKTDVSPVFIKRWLNRGVHVVAWTVNDLDQKRYYDSVYCPYMTDTLM